MQSRKKQCDLLVAGGGVFGLWVAKHAIDAGLSVVLAEKGKIGSGASGGLLGALMAHIPTNWNAKKQFQFDALHELSAEIAALEEETGKKTGYGRIGRLMPLREERFVETAKTREKAAQINWQQNDAAYHFKPCHDQRYAGWLSTDFAPHGYVLDDFAARLQPGAYLDALATYVRERATIMEGTELSRIRSDGVDLTGSPTINPQKIVLAQGYETYAFLQQHFGLDLGSGVKGQSVAFALPWQEGRPVIYDDGVYLVPHENGLCAVGSTTQKNWVDPAVPDPEQNSFLDKAFQLCPMLRSCPIVDQWAGVRPKSYEREPIIGRLPNNLSIYVATGGFKVSFGIAHRVANALVEEITEATPSLSLPETFKIAHHLKQARKR